MSARQNIVITAALGAAWWWEAVGIASVGHHDPTTGLPELAWIVAANVAFLLMGAFACVVTWELWSGGAPDAD